MSNIPAFPSKQKALMIKSEHIDIASEYEIEHNGMTLRDYFAAKAMQALISEPSLKATMDEFAHRAYQIADIMMEERQP
jgi:galactose-1-phosphate uridylyltransferase